MSRTTISVGAGEPVLAPGDHLDADGRMGDGVEVGQGLGVAEDEGGHPGAVDPAVVIEDAHPETIDHRLVGGTPGLDHLPSHQVGIDEGGPVLDQQLGHGGFTGTDATGEADREHRTPDQAVRRGRDAVANNTMVVRSSSSVTKKSSAVMPVIPPASPRAMSL